MTGTNIVMVFSSVVIIVLAFIVAKLMIGIERCNVELNRVNSQRLADSNMCRSEIMFYKSEWSKAVDLNKVIGDEMKIYKSRMVDIEDAIKKERGISIRNEVIKIDLPFNKLDFVILYSGVCKLLKDSGVLADSEAYIKILKSLQETIDKLPEPVEEKNGKPI